MSKLSAAGRGLPPILPSRETNIYIYTIVSAYVLIPVSNHNSVIFSVSQGTEKLNKLPQAHRNPDNSIVLLMFNNNTYIISEQPTNTS